MSTLTTTSSLTFASTQTATTTLGSNATITTAGSSDSLYETGNDSVVSDVGSGTRVRTINYGGNDGNSSTFTTTYSSYDSSGDSFTQTLSDTQSLGSNGTIASGPDLGTLTSHGSSTYTYSESGGRTISWGSGGYLGGSYTDSETTSQSYTLSDNTSMAFGTNGTIASGTVASLTTQTYSDSQSDSDVRRRLHSRPGGRAAGQQRAHQLQRQHQLRLQHQPRHRDPGALGTISGGGNSFTFIQSDYNSLSINTPETDTASYTMTMSGTETYAPGGSISGGSDNFTWNQNAYDKTTIVYDQLAGTATQTNYEMLVTDTVSDSMSDLGSDVLGPATRSSPTATATRSSTGGRSRPRSWTAARRPVPSISRPTAPTTTPRPTTAPAPCRRRARPTAPTRSPSTNSAATATTIANPSAPPRTIGAAPVIRTPTRT